MLEPGRLLETQSRGGLIAENYILWDRGAWTKKVKVLLEDMPATYVCLMCNALVKSYNR